MPPHLIVKDEQVVIKCQYGSAGQKRLVESLVPEATYKFTRGHTFATVLITERAAP